MIVSRSATPRKLAPTWKPHSWAFSPTNSGEKSGCSSRNCANLSICPARINHCVFMTCSFSRNPAVEQARRFVQCEPYVLRKLLPSLGSFSPVLIEHHAPVLRRPQCFGGNLALIYE